MHRMAFLLAMVVGVAAVGCGPKRTMRPPPKSLPTKVVSLSPGTTEILVGSTNVQLAGRTASDNYPPRATSIPVVGSLKPDYEKIAAMKPTHIVYDAALYSAQDVEKLKTAAGTAQIYALNANTIDEFIDELYAIGSLLLAETSVNDYANKILAARNTALGVATDPKPKVVVIMPGSGRQDMIAGTKSFVADAVRAAGGEPIGPDTALFSPLNSEAMVAFNPDVIIVPGTKSDVEGAKMVASNPSYKTVNAIKNGRLRVLDADVLLRRGGRVDVLIEALHGAISGGKS